MVRARDLGGREVGDPLTEDRVVQRSKKENRESNGKCKDRKEGEQ